MRPDGITNTEMSHDVTVKPDGGRAGARSCAAAAERSARRSRGRRMKTMPASWKLLLLPTLLLMTSCGRTDTKTLDPTQTPPASVPPLADLKREVVLKSENVTENIELRQLVRLFLECSLTADQNKLPNMTAFWSRDGQEIPDSRLTVALEKEQYGIQRLFNITSEEKVGTYSCVFENKVRADFVLATPRFREKRDKPVVSYVHDFVVLPCKMEGSENESLTWLWFKGNETHKERISAQPDRFEIRSQNLTSRLKLINLTFADAGFYYCAAVYAVGSTMNPIKLKVITFWEPLKPFIAILIAVVLLVVVIFLCEKQQSKKKVTEGNEENVDQNNIK
uniref:Embigin n=2 Tax=Oryzias latipes TaxID=8090 RepID=H2L3Q3_ORYLA